MIKLHWPLVIGTTIILYVSILICLPFNAKYATISLFLLIAFWSRLPGVGIYHPFFIIYNADLVDLFCMIVAINVGGVEGALFSIFANIVSRACGVFPEWGAVISDIAAMGIICLMIPYIHQLFGEDLFISIIIFTILRALMWIPLDFIFWPQPPAKYAITWIGSVAANGFMNATYAYFFGPFFDSLLLQGVRFNWGLFLIITITIFAGKFYLYDLGKEDSWISRYKRKITRRYEQFEKRFFLKRKITELEIEVKNIDIKKHMISTDLHIPDPHEIILTYFNNGNRNSITAGSLKDFKFRGFIMIGVFIVLKLLSVSIFPGIIWSAITLSIIWLGIKGLVHLIHKINESSKQSVERLFSSFFVMTVMLLIIGRILLIV